MSEANETETDGDRIVLEDPDDYAKTQKIRRLNSLKSKVQRWDRPDMDGIERYYRRIRHYGSELLPVIQEALENGTIHKDDLRYSTDTDNPNSTFDVLKFLQTGQCHYVTISDGTERFHKAKMTSRSPFTIRDGVTLGNQGTFEARFHRDTLDRHFAKMIEAESKLGLGFSFEKQKGPAQL